MGVLVCLSGGLRANHLCGRLKIGPDVIERLPDVGALCDEGDQAHLPAAAWTQQVKTWYLSHISAADRQCADHRGAAGSGVVGTAAHIDASPGSSKLAMAGLV